MNIIQKIKNRFYLFLRNIALNSNIIGKNVFVDEGTFLKAVVLSGNTQIGKLCKVFGADINGNVRIGNNTSLWGPNITIKSTVNKIIIGNYCSVARNVSIQEMNHNIERFTSHYINKNILNIADEDNVSKGDIIIGHDVWIGDGTKILSGVRIGIGAVIGANSVVTKDVPNYAIVVGSPARIIKYRFPPETQEKLIKLEWWNWDQFELKKRVAELDELVGYHN